MITTIKEFRKLNEALDINVITKNKADLIRLIEDNMKEFGDECNLNFIDVSNIKDMEDLFENSKFNGDISEWNTSKVTNMNNMFYGSKFNGDISNWDVSKVTDMKWMFQKSEFNQDISDWDVSNVENMSYMFQYNKVFNQNLENWKLHPNCNTLNMFKDSKLAKDKNLPTWYKP